MLLIPLQARTLEHSCADDDVCHAEVCRRMTPWSAEAAWRRCTVLLLAIVCHSHITIISTLLATRLDPLTPDNVKLLTNGSALL